MTRRIITYIIIAIPAIFLLVYLLKGRAPFGRDNSSFAARPKKEVTRIEFTDGSNRLSLVKEGEKWLVNGKFEARKSSILFIIKILTQQEIKSPVTAELFENEIVKTGVIPVRVKVYEHNKNLRSFLVYKTNSNKYGNIMKIREKSIPFIVYVPGNEVEIGSAFTLNELFWQPYNVFNLLPSEISSVKFENIKSPDSSFTIRNDIKKFYLSDLKNDLSGWDTSRVVRYLSYFTHIPFESWAFDLSSDEKERIIKENPVYRITVKKSDGNNTILNLWERLIEKDNVETVDSDRLWGMIEGGKEIFVIRYMDIDPLLKKRSYFFPG